MPERKKLGELLLEAKIINATQLQSAIAHQRQWGVRLGTALIEKGFVDEATLAKFLGQQRGMQSVTLSGMKVAPEVLKRIPKEMQEKHLAVPIAVEKLNNRETLVIAMVDPSNLQALDEIKFAIGATRTRYVIAVEAAVKKMILGDTRAFRQPVNAPAAPEPPPAEVPMETTGEFQIVRGTVESTVNSKGAVNSPPAVMPGTGTMRTTARGGVESQPVGELELDLEAEITDIEPADIDDASLEPIVTNVGPAPTAAPVTPPAPAPAAGDPFLDALRGPPRTAAASAPAAAAPARPSWPPNSPPTPAPAAVATPARPVSPSKPAMASPVPPPVALFDAPDEDHTERDIQIPVVAAPPPIPEMPVEALDGNPAPFAETVVPTPAVTDAWANSPADDPWPENNAVEQPFEPLAEAAPWPANGGSEQVDAPDTLPGAVPGTLDETDLGPGAVPVMASGVSPLEASVPEISLPGPEMPSGMPSMRLGAFDPDTAPETDAGPGGMFAIPSELEVQEGSMPGVARGQEPPMLPPVENLEPAAQPAWGAEPGLEATAADEPYPPVEDGFAPETTVSEPPLATSADPTAPEMPIETFSNTSVMPPVFQTDPTAPETEIDSPPAMEEAPPPSMPDVAPVAPPVSSSAGMVPDFSTGEPPENMESTRVGSGHNEPVWDAPMEFTAPPEGSVLADAPPDRPLPGPAVNIRPDHDDERQSVTRESPFPRGTEFDRAPAMLSARHVDEPPAESFEPAPEAVMEAPSPAVDVEMPPLSEGTPPTRQSEVPGPTVRVPPGMADGVPPAPPPPAAVAMPAPIPSPPPPPPKELTPPSPDVSSTGPVAAAAAAVVSEEQAALNMLVTKKLKLLNAITEILLEKGLITEDEIKEKISKKKS